MNEGRHASRNRLWRMVQTWRTMPSFDKRLARELAWELARARLEVSFLPFRTYARDLGEPDTAHTRVDAADAEPDPDTLHLLRRARTLTTALQDVLPWDCSCLVRAITAFRVLACRGCRTRLYLGARTNPAEMEAHAWPACGRRTITGQEEALDFFPLALFRGRDAPLDAGREIRP